MAEQREWETFERTFDVAEVREKIREHLDASIEWFAADPNVGLSPAWRAAYGPAEAVFELWREAVWAAGYSTARDPGVIAGRTDPARIVVSGWVCWDVNVSAGPCVIGSRDAVQAGRREHARQAEAEAKYGHPLQYALVGKVYVGNTEDLDDAAVVALADVHLPVERFNRCPTCEQWSPCRVRAAEAANRRG